MALPLNISPPHGGKGVSMKGGGVNGGKGGRGNWGRRMGEAFKFNNYNLRRCEYYHIGEREKGEGKREGGRKRCHWG